MTEILDRIRASLVGLRMARALEALDHTLRRLERGEITAIEAIDGLLAEEHVTREGRRVTVAVKTARLMPIKTLESFDFSFQPSLDRGRILALAQLHFIERAEVVHLLGPPGTGKSQVSIARRVRCHGEVDEVLCFDEVIADWTRFLACREPGHGVGANQAGSGRRP